jgi:hypothetical protein
MIAGQILLIARDGSSGAAQDEKYRFFIATVSWLRSNVLSFLSS